MFKGFPGETAADLVETAQFLERHSDRIDRIRFNEFSVLEGTPVHDAMCADPPRIPELRVLRHDARNGSIRYRNLDTGTRAYRRAKRRVLDIVYRINRREVRRTARAFDGLM
jgi:tRNA A37 methylthiotransferase MiaB